MASNEKNFVVKNGITIGQGAGSPYTLQSTDGTSDQILVTDGSGNVTWQTRILEDISDVSISTPLDNQVLTYDVNTSTWINSNNITLTSGTFETITADTTYVTDGNEPQGTLFWDPDYSTLAAKLNSAVLQIGQETLFRVTNQTASQIDKGTAVRFSGTTGNSGKLTIEPMIADGTFPSEYFMGLATENIVAGEEGFVTQFGKIRQLDTTNTGEGWIDGDILYVSSTTAGELTKVPPTAPNNKITVAAIVHADANGTLMVRPTSTPKISGLEDVSITSNSDGELLRWDGTKWINNTLAEAGIDKTYIDGLNVDADTLDSQDGTYYLDFNNFTNLPDPTITLGGDLTGSVTLTDLGSGTLTATIAADSVSLGTDTTGDYVATIAGTANEVEVTGSGSESAAVTVGLPNDVTISNNLTVSNDATVTNSLSVNNALNLKDTLNLISPDELNTVVVRMLDSDTVTFSGESGQLFSITDNLTGTIFAVNDISGVPSIEVDDDGTIRFAELFGNVLIGTDVDDGINKLQVSGTSSFFSDVSIAENLTVQGNLTVSGTTTTVNTETIELADNVIILNSNYSGSAPTENSGIEINRGTLTNSVLQWNETNDYWEISSGGTTGRILTTGDEGTGNGLDADTLDTQEGSYYLDFTNFTNLPDPTLTLDGDVSGSATFTNLGNATLTVTVADDSHNHIIANIDNLQTTLDAKLEDGDHWTLSGTDLYYNVGNVGVGTATPQAPLHIATDAGTSPTVRIRTNNSYFDISGDASSRAIFEHAGQSFWFKNPLRLDGLTNDSHLSLTNGAEIRSGSGDIILNPGGAVHSVVFQGDASQSDDYLKVRSDGSSTGDIFVIDSSGQVGVGVDTPSDTLEVNGSFSATTKSFVINHPTKEGKKLRYGSLEGPENGVYVRGRLTNNYIIDLPSYWVELVDENSITVQLTAIGSGQQLFVDNIVDNKVFVKNGNVLNKFIDCFYLVQAERKDVERLEVEY